MPDPQPGDDRSEALARYLTGESPPEERAALRGWLAEDPEREAAFRALEEQTRRLAFTPPADLDVDAAWRRTARHLGDKAVPLAPGAHRRRPPLAAIAAVVALVTLGGVQLWRFLSPETGSREYTTAVGRRDSIRFEDGGRIVLAPGSRMTAEHRPGARPREVELEGEAYFEIPHDPARPFQVRTGDAEITDLGTTFTVRGRTGGAVQVQVMEGSVGLKARAGGNNGVVLAAGDRGTLDSAGDLRVTRGVTAGGTPAWVEGRLEFENTPLAEVRADLRRWYGVELLVADSALTARHVTASFRGEPVSQVLDVIALTLGASVELRGDTAFLRPLPGIPSSQ